MAFSGKAFFFVSAYQKYILIVKLFFFSFDDIPMINQLVDYGKYVNLFNVDEMKCFPDGEFFWLKKCSMLPGGGGSDSDGGGSC